MCVFCVPASSHSERAVIVPLLRCEGWKREKDRLMCLARPLSLFLSFSLPLSLSPNTKLRSDKSSQAFMLLIVISLYRSLFWFPLSMRGSARLGHGSRIDFSLRSHSRAKAPSPCFFVLRQRAVSNEAWVGPESHSHCFLQPLQSKSMASPAPSTVNKHQWRHLALGTDPRPIW